MQPNSIVVSIYSEATPNPETMKFVMNRMLFPKNSVDFPKPADAEGASPLATALFTEFEYVKGVFIMNNFVTVTKTPETEWFEITPALREFIRQYVADGHPIIDEAGIQEMLDAQPNGDPNRVNESDPEVVKKIKEMLTKFVQPAVEMDGGAIVFRDYKEGIVTLGMQGACSGCPSSSVTLQQGIEGLLKRMVPEVQSVVAEAM